MLWRLAAGSARQVGHVAAVSDPFSDPAGVSQDGTTLVAHLRLDVENPVDMPLPDSERMLEIQFAGRSPVRAGNQSAAGNSSPK